MIAIFDNIFICIGLPLLGGFLNSIATRKAVNSQWYQNIRKPWYNPPNFIFGPVWTILYITIGLSLYWFQESYKKLNFENEDFYNKTIIIYFIQLTFNLLWSYIFFISRAIKLALLDMVGMITTTLVLMYNFNLINPYAALILVPYLLWISFATFLTFNIMILNPNFSHDENTLNPLLR